MKRVELKGGAAPVRSGDARAGGRVARARAEAPTPPPSPPAPPPREGPCRAVVPGGGGRETGFEEVSPEPSGLLRQGTEVMPWRLTFPREECDP